MILSILSRERDRTVNFFHYSLRSVIARSVIARCPGSIVPDRLHERFWSFNDHF